MRVNEPLRSSAADAKRGAKRAVGPGGFAALLAPDASTPAQSVARSTPTTGLMGILALQQVDDPTTRRSAGLKRGGALLDHLEDIRRSLVLGDVTVAKLQQIAAMVGTEDRSGDPRLDSILDEIGLRAAVELAKHGLYSVASSCA
jgi:Class II flagellar assembly regulator